jgi:hypothetical protein
MEAEAAFALLIGMIAIIHNFGYVSFRNDGHSAQAALKPPSWTDIP